MKLTPWYLAALAPIAIAGCSGALMGHVAVLAVRGRERGACRPHGGSRAARRAGAHVRTRAGLIMEILLLLIPLSVALAVLIGAAFWWSVANGQFDDLEGPAHRILSDDDSVGGEGAQAENRHP